MRNSIKSGQFKRGAFVRGSISCLALLASGVVGISAAAAQEAVLQQPVGSVEQAIEAAINNQPEVRSRWQAFLAAGQDRRAAKAGYLPTVEVSGEFGQANREYDERGWYDRNFGEISVTQMLFDGFLVRSQLREADETRLQRYYELLDEVQLKALEAIEAYEDVRAYRQTLSLAQRNYQTHEGVLALIKERTDSGVAAGADMQQATGRLALAQSNLLTEEANLHDVSARFQRIVGARPAETMADFTVASASVPADFGAVMQSAFQNHPSLFAAHAGVQSADANADEARAAHFPRVTIGARHGSYRNTSSFDERFDPTDRGQESFVGLNVNYDLYRGGANQAREGAARRRLAQTEALLDKACVDLRQTAAISWNNVVNLKAKLGALDAHRTASENVAATYEQQFYIGRRTLLDVLDAKNEAFQAQRSYAQAQHELNKAYYRTIYAMGTVLDVVGQSRRGLPAISDFDNDANRPAAIDCSRASSPSS